MGGISSPSQHVTTPACQPGTALSSHTRSSIHLLLIKRTTVRFRNLPKAEHGKGAKKRKKKRTHPPLLLAPCPGSAGIPHPTTCSYNASCRSGGSARGMRKGASLHPSVRSGWGSGEERRHPAQKSLQDITATPTLSDAKSPGEKKGCRHHIQSWSHPPLPPLHPLLQGAQSSLEPGSLPSALPQARPHQSCHCDLLNLLSY